MRISKNNIEIAHKFVNKTEQERKGINNAVLTAGIIVSLLLPSLTYSGVIPALIESTSVQSRQAIQIIQTIQMFQKASLRLTVTVIQTTRANMRCPLIRAAIIYIRATESI